MQVSMVYSKMQNLTDIQVKDGSLWVTVVWGNLTEKIVFILNLQVLEFVSTHSMSSSPFLPKYIRRQKQR